ncbi:MAG TPA: hypothetical protein PKW97_06615 [Syntrophorhabdus sp.]|nr:hypothetical protein [Syntrophorhabdus sp.]HOD77642.1 hypothetical protein [Syntrophorhabdus sp.]HQI95897.1 hypothetical protein [Syntrophorhabdus sp.]HQM26173.1 hypothetical protein [Syntrophorhabdus sp.]
MPIEMVLRKKFRKIACTLPDHSIVYRFRNTCMELGIYEKLLIKISPQIEYCLPLIGT